MPTDPSPKPNLMLATIADYTPPPPKRRPYKKAPVAAGAN